MQVLIYTLFCLICEQGGQNINFKKTGYDEEHKTKTAVKVNNQNLAEMDDFTYHCSIIILME